MGVGSRHANGARYVYEEGSEPPEVEIAPLPKWLERLLVTHDDERQPTSAAPDGSSDGIVDGERNQTLTSLAGRLRNLGLDPEAIVQTLAVENRKKCRPPLDEDEVARIAQSVGRYAIHATSSQDEAELVMGRVLAEHYNNGINLLYAADGSFWSFDVTHWQMLPQSNLNNVVLGVIQSLPTRNRQNTSSLLSQVQALLKARCSKPGDLLRFAAEPPPVVNCRNCELWIRSDGSVEARPHDPKSYLRHCFNVDYDPEAGCPRYDLAVEQIFGSCKEPAKLAAFWDELMGYVMQPARPQPTIVIGRGGGSNGKTALLQLLVQLMGRGLVHAVEIQELDRNRFAVGDLDGKLLLLDDDVKAGTRLPDGNLKKVSEAKIISGEHKFGPSFPFTVRTVPILLCNNLPSIADLSYGLRRRLMVVPFDRRFKKDEIDVGLFKYISSRELPGVLNRYLRGLQRLMRAGWQFEIPEAVAAATEEFVVGANPLPAFIAQECEKTGQSWIKELFGHYESWCQDNGITYRQQRINFGRNLQNLGYKVTHGNRGDIVRGLRHSPSH